MFTVIGSCTGIHVHVCLYIDERMCDLPPRIPIETLYIGYESFTIHKVPSERHLCGATRLICCANRKFCYIFFNWHLEGVCISYHMPPVLNYSRAGATHSLSHVPNMGTPYSRSHVGSIINSTPNLSQSSLAQYFSKKEQSWKIFLHIGWQ